LELPRRIRRRFLIDFLGWTRPVQGNREVAVSASASASGSSRLIKARSPLKANPGKEAPLLSDYPSIPTKERIWIIINQWNPFFSHPFGD